MTTEADQLGGMVTSRLLDVQGPIYFRLGVVERGGAKHGETIYFADGDCHFIDHVEAYCHESNNVVRKPVRKVRVIAVGKTVPYGIVLLNRPFRTALVVSEKGDDQCIVMTVEPRLAEAISFDARYTEKCRLDREFEGHLRAYLRRMEEFFDERPSRPLADGH